MKFFIFFSFCLHVTLWADVAHYHRLADERQLHSERYWQLLLHVSNGSSEIDDPEFFLSPSGKRDFKSELHATLDALYAERYFDDNATACRFPARTAWLRERLDLQGLPDVTCNEYDTLVRKINPRSVTLVFADAHINSPASMFGHTFLRIDSAYESKLLSHAINYAANADQSKENGVVFAIKGLFGGYPGIYSLLPYYEKLSEYKSTEQRDIWEYELNLSEEEVRRMVAHIWELHVTYSWYYFFDENCSYHMLWLLEVARPSVHLREYFWYQVIPPETVMAVEAEGMIAKKRFRPSKRAMLLAYEAALTPRERLLAMSVALGEYEVATLLSDPEISAPKRRRLLEASAELCEYYLIENRLSKERYLELFQKILKARSTLGRSDALHVKVPANPLLAHPSSKISYALGSLEGDLTHYFGVRASYQAIGEADEGLLEGTQIEFFDLLLRYGHEERMDQTAKRVEFDHATVISLTSLAMRGDFFTPFSWRMRLGWDRDASDERLRLHARLGAGASWGGDYGYMYLLAEPFAYYDPQQPKAGLMGTTGALLRLAQGWYSAWEYGYRLYYDGDRQHLFKATQRVMLRSDTGLGVEYRFLGRDGRDENRFKALLDYYF